MTLLTFVYLIGGLILLVAGVLLRRLGKGRSDAGEAA